MAPEGNPADAVNGRPCAECPFRRDVPADICQRFRSDPSAFIGQVHGPFVLPCHKDSAFKVDARDPALRPCAGARAFRANVAAGLVAVPGDLVGAADPVTYFATEAEFMAHHLAVPVDMAVFFLRRYPPVVLLSIELARPGVRAVLPPSE